MEPPAGAAAAVASDIVPPTLATAPVEPTTAPVAPEPSTASAPAPSSWWGSLTASLTAAERAGAHLLQQAAATVQSDLSEFVAVVTSDTTTAIQAAARAAAMAKPSDDSPVVSSSTRDCGDEDPLSPPTPVFAAVAARSTAGDGGDVEMKARAALQRLEAAGEEEDDLPDWDMGDTTNEKNVAATSAAAPPEESA